MRRGNGSDRRATWRVKVVPTSHARLAMPPLPATGGDPTAGGNGRAPGRHPPVTLTAGSSLQRGRGARVQDTAAVEERGGGWSLIGRSIRKQWFGIAVGVFVGLVWTAGKVSVPLFIKLAIDRGIEGNEDGALIRWSLFIAGAGIVSGVFTGLRRWFAFKEARWTESDLRDRLFAHLQRLHFAFHDRAQTGQLMSRANTDLQQIQAFVVMIPLTMSNGVTVIAVTGILLTIDPLLTLLALGSLPFLNVLATRFSRKLHPAVMGIQQESAELAAVVEETVAGVRVVKGFGAERVQAGRLRVEADDVYGRSMEAARVRATFLPALELLPNIGLIATLGYGGHQVLEGQLTLGELVGFNVFVVMLI